jgi:cytochrome oxidase Cu insertion factor (SCO1/SenC/PrrC family)
MNRSISMTVALMLISAFALAQQKKKSEEAFVREKPSVGDRAPDVVVYDTQGKEVPLASLRGHHVVLTFGCLT